MIFFTFVRAQCLLSKGVYLLFLTNIYLAVIPKAYYTSSLEGLIYNSTLADPALNRENTVLILPLSHVE